MTDSSTVTVQHGGGSTSQDVHDGLFEALKRLDDILERAVAAAQDFYGPQAALDRFRGLHIGHEDVVRLLAREPGTPLLNTIEESSCESAITSSQIAWLKEAFNLSSFDVDLVLIALAPEIDLRYERLYSYLQDDVMRRRPSVDLAMNLLCSSREERIRRRGHLNPASPLMCHRLLRLVPPPNQLDPPLLAHAIQLDPQIVDVLLCQDGLDRRLASFCQVISRSTTIEELPLSETIKHQLMNLVRCAVVSHNPLRLYFRGPHGIGKRRVAEALSHMFGKYLLYADLTAMQSAEIGFEEAIRLTFREAWLQGAILYLDDIASLDNSDQTTSYRYLSQCLSNFNGVAILAGTEPWISTRHVPLGVAEVCFPMPGFAERRRCWDSALRGQNIPFSESDLNVLTGRFRLNGGQVGNAVNLAKYYAISRSSGERLATVGLGDLVAAARAQSSHALAALARKIDPVYTWGDIVLPEDVIQQLRELCARVVQGPRVFGEWDFGHKLSEGKGANALFAGPSGTGKTMAAEVIAKELCLDLYKIDLARVVSKYIGETEKNLDRIFVAAEDANAILFFDEADALFGRRSEVRDSHDRYANIEISYLLQKMERYEGVAILATNLRQSLDEAFIRRLAFTVHFPFPTEADRLRIWAGIWPKEIPVVADVHLKFLSRQFKLTGGNIKNIALGAAFSAASDGGAITMSHLLRATRREFQKMGKTLSEAELSGLTTGIEQDASA